MRKLSCIKSLQGLLFAVLAASLVLIFIRPSLFNESMNSIVAASKQRTAVFFAFNEASSQDTASLSYFLEAGVWDSPSVDYFFIINGEKCSLRQHPKLSLPNVKLMQRENVGFDFAAYKHALSSIVFTDYAFFIFLNSGVRGPLLPKHQLQNIKTWPLIFTSMLNEKVKLVGPTITCEEQVHLQSHFFALDYEGLMVVWDAGVFLPAKGETFRDLILHSELGLTNAIMSKGFTIDSLLIQYSGMDWLSNWNNGHKGAYSSKNPNIENQYGTTVKGLQYSLNHLEVVFAKRGGTVRKKCANEIDGKKVCNYDAAIDDTCNWTLAYLNQQAL